MLSEEAVVFGVKCLLSMALAEPRQAHCTVQHLALPPQLAQ